MLTTGLINKFNEVYDHILYFFIIYYRRVLKFNMERKVFFKVVHLLFFLFLGVSLKIKH